MYHIIQKWLNLTLAAIQVTWVLCLIIPRTIVTFPKETNNIKDPRVLQQ